LKVPVITIEMHNYKDDTQRCGGASGGCSGVNGDGAGSVGGGREVVKTVSYVWVSYQVLHAMMLDSEGRTRPGVKERFTAR
jgi:hypothetical protein